MSREHGLWGFLGAMGWYSEIRAAAEWLAELHDREVTAWDDFDNATGGILGPLAGKHRLTPPSVHPRAIVCNGWPEFDQEASIRFLVLSAGNLEPLAPLSKTSLQGAILLGHLDDLRELAREKKVRMEPLRQLAEEPWLSVRIR